MRALRLPHTFVFRGALNDRDSVDIAAVLHPDVQLIAPTGDTLRGPLVVQYFMYVATDGRQTSSGPPLA